MNREIKFRVWDDTYKYMNYKVLVGIYGDWEKVKDDKNYTACAMWIEPDKVDYKCEPHWTHFEPYHKDIHLMQYTGLKDKNGIEVYERDICKGNNFSDEDDLFIIKYGKYKTNDWKEKYICNTYQYGWFAEHIKTKDQVHLVTPNGIEVIGNIYENEVEEVK